MYSDPYERFVHKPVERHPAIAPVVPRERVQPGPPDPTPWNEDPDVLSLLSQFRLIASVVRPNDMHPLRVADILSLVSHLSGLPVTEILSDRRCTSTVKARHIVAWLARRFTHRSLKEIGRQLGKRDHTTLMHGLSRVDYAVSDIQLAAEPNTLGAWAVALWRADWPPIAGRGRRGPGRAQP